MSLLRELQEDGTCQLKQTLPCLESIAKDLATARSRPPEPRPSTATMASRALSIVRPPRFFDTEACRSLPPTQVCFQASCRLTQTDWKSW